MKLRFVKVFLICVVGIYANVNIQSKQDIYKIKKGLASVALQEQKKIEKVKLKKYFLARTQEKPSFFGSNDMVYEFYLTAFLQKGRPVWLENNHFVFDTSASKNYLKRVQKNYAKKYKIDLILYTNEKFWKKTYARRKVNIEEMTRYIDKKISLYNEKIVPTVKKERVQKKTVQKKEIKALPLVNAEVKTKKEAKKVYKGIRSLAKQVEKKTKSVALQRYFLAKTVQKPSLFGSMKPIYNFYLTSILNNGTAAWLDDGRFVFHTANGKKYLKNMQKFYKKKYHLELTLYKNSHYKKENVVLMPTDLSDVIVSLEKQIPQKLQKKNKIVPTVKKERVQKKTIQKKEIKALPLVNAEVKTKKEAKKVYKGIRSLAKQVEKKTKSVALQRYFLAKTVQKPSLFGSMKPIYNFYLTSILNNGTAAWLDDGRFVFHTANGKKYLKNMQKFYKKKYHLELTLYKNSHYKKENVVLMPTDLSDVIVSLEKQIPQRLRKNMAEEDKRKALEKQRREVRTKERKILQKKKLEKERKEKREQARKEKSKLEAKKRALAEENARKEKQKNLELKRKREAEKKRAKALADKRRQKQIDTKVKIEEKVRKQTMQEKAQQEAQLQKIKDAQSQVHEQEQARKKLLEEEKKRVAEEKRKIEAEKKALAEEKRKIEARKKALAKQKELKRLAEEQKEQEKAKKAAIAKEKERFIAEKRKIEAEKKALAEERKKIEERKKALAQEKEKLEAQRKKEQAIKQAKEAEKRRIAKQKKLEAQREAAEKKKQDDALTSDLDAMLKDTKDFKKKLERSESIKYY